jgi:hypothetical protein
MKGAATMKDDKKSEVACFRQLQALEYDAAQRGLNEFAIVATHESITARMERGAERLLQLIVQGKHEEVQALMETPSWGLAESTDEISAGHPVTLSDQVDEGKTRHLSHEDEPLMMKA